MNLKTTAVASAIACLAVATAEAQTETNAAPKKPTWESSAGVGLTLTRGNSENLTATANILTAKKWEKNELSLGADGTYGEADSEKNAEAAHGFVQYNRLFTERWFGYARADATYDAIADLDYRLSLSPGIGYYFIKNDRTLLSGEFGPGYVFEKLGGDEDDYATLRIGEKFEHKLSPNARVWQTAEFVPQVNRFENYVFTFEVGIETSVSKNLNLRVSLLDIYRSEPAPGRKENDMRLMAGLQYKF